MLLGENSTGMKVKWGLQEGETLKQVCWECTWEQTNTVLLLCIPAPAQGEVLHAGNRQHKLLFALQSRSCVDGQVTMQCCIHEASSQRLQHGTADLRRFAGDL